MWRAVKSLLLTSCLLNRQSGYTTDIKAWEKGVIHYWGPIIKTDWWTHEWWSITDLTTLFKVSHVHTKGKATQISADTFKFCFKALSFEYNQILLQHLKCFEAWFFINWNGYIFFRIGIEVMLTFDYKGRGQVIQMFVSSMWQVKSGGGSGCSGCPPFIVY